MSTKGAKYNSDKSQLSLIPYAPLCTVADVLAYGCRKYSRDNWKHVPDARVRYTDALLRHAHAYADGETLDPESGHHHLAHAACNALFILWFDLHQDNSESVCDAFQRAMSRATQELKAVRKRSAPSPLLQEP